MAIELFEGIVTIEAQYLRKLEKVFEASTQALKANHELLRENQRLQEALKRIESGHLCRAHHCTCGRSPEEIARAALEAYRSEEK